MAGRSGFGLLVGLLILALTPVQAFSVEPRRGLIVKFRAEGPAALEECAEAVARAQRPFASATRDRSTSLDEVFLRHRLKAPRVVFPAGGAGGLGDRRAALARRQAARATARASTPRRGAPQLSDLAYIYRVEVDPAVDLEAALEALAADPHVEYVQRDHELVLDQTGPPPGPPFDDPYLTSSGSWGQPYADLWGPPLVRAPEVWPFAQGEGVVVAVVDTGIDQGHPDIAANLWVNPGEDLDGNGRADPTDLNGIDDDDNGFIDDLTGFDFANSVDANEDGDYDDPGDVSDADPQDDQGHGTHVAGTIAAVANNGIGIVGIAPAARVMALKGFSVDGSSSDSVLWRAVLYAAENGAAVVNNSWSCGSPCPLNPLAEEVLELVEELGTIVVTSAGNRSADVAFYSPENGSRVITVGAISVDSSLPAFTNRGWLLDLMAPGGGPETPYTVPVARLNILSLLAEGTFQNESAFIVGDQYLRLAGTSMSSPHVAGAVAILRGLRPELTPTDVRTLVRLSASNLGSPGYDPEFGAGLLDVAALVAAPLPELVFELDAPRVGRLHDPASGPVEIRGVASGPDLAALEISMARGLSGREFRPLDSFGSARVKKIGGSRPGEFAAFWDVDEVPDGPHVIRVRARLRDGRHLEEFSIVGIERNAPVRISHGALDTGNPALSGTALVWQVDEDADSPQTHDLVVGRFPDGAKTSPIPDRVLVREGNQLSGLREGHVLAWLEPAGPTRRVLLWCRLAGKSPCNPLLASQEAGSIGPAHLAGGWLVWARTDAGRRSIEGCPVGRVRSGCVPRLLIDPATGADWILHSFDGESLLVSRPGRFVRCRLDGRSEFCVPEEVRLPSGMSAVEPRLDGDLMAFGQTEIEQIRPPGCAPADPRPSCAPQVTVVVEYLACAIDPVTSFCDPIVLTDQQPVERALGIAVSGRRVVWSIGRSDEQPALWYCEFDPVARACRAQRVGGVLATQAEPAIDGHRLVWADGRTGPIAVYGIALPDLSGPADRTLKPGIAFAIGLDAESGSSPTLRYEIEPIEGTTPKAAFAKILDGGPPGGRILLLGRIPGSASGTTRWRLRAIGGGGFVSEHVIELAIVPRPSPQTSSGGLSDGR